MAERGTPRGNGMRARKPRILFLPMEGRGLGHLSRSCKLARSLQSTASCLIGTGVRYAGNLVPEQCEYVRIPGLDGLFESRATERGKVPFVDLTPEQSVDFRRQLLCTLERMFRPDLIVTDILPAGDYSELADMLARSHAKKFILLRSILGIESIGAIRRFSLEALTQFYDALVIASDPRTAQVDEDLQFTDRERSQSHYIGYVSTPVSQKEIEGARYRRGLKPGDSWIVCSAGSGFYNTRNFDDWMSLTKDFTGVHFDLVLGPSYMGNIPSGTPSIFFEGRVRVTTEQPDLRIAHAAADVVLSHGGYNTLTETMEGGAPLVVDVRHDPLLERRRHALQLQPYYPIFVAQSPSELKLGLNEALNGRVNRRPVRATKSLKFDGCDEFGQLVSEHLGLCVPNAATN